MSKDENNEIMKWSELIKLVEEQGYRLYSHGKKHDIYVNSHGNRLVLERHRSQEVRKGLESKIKKQIGL